MVWPLEAVHLRRRADTAKSGRDRGETWSSDRDAADFAFPSASALSRNAKDGGGEHCFRSRRRRSGASLSLSNPDNMSVGLSVAIDEPGLGTCATCGRTLTQAGPNGECLRCLVSLGFLSDSQP